MTATRVADASAARATGPAYAAFISYSRDADHRLAPRLEYALERFATPWYRLRAFRVFRDDASLSSNPGLWSSLTDALDGVGHFILLASPGAAQSLWVGREVEYWLEHREPEHMLLVLTDGEIVWDEATGDFDWERTTALPRTIAGAFSEEPRYTDLRFGAHSDHLTVRDPRFRAAVADIAAPLHGIAKDDLIGEEVRQHRRTMRIARAAGISLVLLTAVAAVAAFLAILSARSANRERDRAQREASVATSRQLAAQSTVSLQADDLDGALSQAARAWRSDHTTEARDALLASLKGAGGLEAVIRGPRPDHLAFSGDRRKLATVGSDHRVSVLDLTTQRQSRTSVVLPRPHQVDAVALDAGGTRLAVGYWGGTVDLWDLARGRVRKLAGPVRTPPHGAAPVFSADGTRLAWGGGGRQIFVWDGRRTRRLTVPSSPGDAPWEVALSSDGRYLAATGGPDFLITVWRLGSGARPREFPGAGATIGTSAGQHGPIALGGGSQPVLASAGLNTGQLVLWNAATGRHIRRLSLHPGFIDSLAFSPHGRLLSVVDPRSVTLVSRAGARVATVSATGAEHGAVPLDEHGRLARVATGGVVTVRQAGAGRSQIAGRLEGTWSLTEIGIDPTSRRVAALDAKTDLRLWDISGGAPVGPPVAKAVDPYEIQFLPDGRVMTCCGPRPDDSGRVWDPGGTGPSGEQPPDPGDTSSIGVTKHGRLVVGSMRGSNFTVTGVGRPLVFHTGQYGAGAISPDGGWAVIDAKQGQDLWDLQRRRKTTSLPDDGFATFSPKGPLVAFSSAPVALYDRSTGRRRGTVGDRDLAVSDMAFSPDGRTLATLGARSTAAGGYRNTLELWDVATRRPVGREPLFTEDSDPFLGSVAFSPDGRRLVMVTGNEEPAFVFDLDVDAWAKRACELAPSCR